MPKIMINSKDRENYGVDDLRSADETDDEDVPRKPIPEWAQDHNLSKCTAQQSRGMINFTRMFRSAANENVNLDQVFKEKKRIFYQRSSSADWKSPPVWRTNGITGYDALNHKTPQYLV